MNRLIDRLGMRNLMVVIGLIAAVTCLILADQYQVNAGYGACGMGIFAGLCMVAAAISEAGARRNHRPPDQPDGRERQ